MYDTYSGTLVLVSCTLHDVNEESRHLTVSSNVLFSLVWACGFVKFSWFSGSRFTVITLTELVVQI